jgi:abortive infection bacteriophage resistance protein
MAATFFQRQSLYHNRFNFKKDLETVDKEIQRSSEVFIKHYKSKYTAPERPPAWMSLEILSLGTLSKLFENLRISPEKKAVAAHFGLNAFVLESWMHTLSHVRNICAHHGRLWNRNSRRFPSCSKILHSNGLEIRQFLPTDSTRLCAAFSIYSTPSHQVILSIRA